ncbi:MAG: DUF4215 domain-containing protein [Kofleriaceae bacterium]
MLSPRLAVVVLLAASTATAAPTSDRARRSHAAPVEVFAAARAGQPVRASVDVAYQAVPVGRSRAWAAFTASAPGLREATWDRATGVPSRIWGRGLDVPGSVADPAVAAAAAWRVLAANLALLAPGSTVSDFQLVANDFDGDQRTIGLVQRHGGLAVVGGQVSFRFKRDRLFVIGSEALPDVTVAWPRQAKLATEVAALATAATVADLGLDHAAVTSRVAPGLEIVPLVGDGGVLGYRVATVVDVDGGAAGGWRVWADPATGAPLVRRSTTPSAVGQIQIDAVERYPGRARRTYPAPLLTATVGAAAGETDAAGGVSWPGAAPVMVRLTATGSQINIENRGGALATLDGTLAADGTLVWRPGDDRAVDAQVSAFVHAGIVRAYARRFAAGLPFLDEPLPVRVNIADQCNAFSDGTSINFFAASDRCENTGTIADVVYHEYGHSLHNHAIIPGVGYFDGAFSEGLSDYLAATITDDSGMGRGFFRSDSPLRELDPTDREHVWPRDIDEIHYTGIIFGGAMWDLRKGLIAELGDHDAAVQIADRLFYAAVRRASSIPATLIEILAADDDDGDLTNGTPHECTIRAAFGRHGLRTLAGDVSAPGLVPAAVEAPQPVWLTVTGADTRCGDDIVAVKAEWRGRDGGISAGNAEASLDGDRYTAMLPLPTVGNVVLYRFRVKFADGSEQVYPENRADQWYQLYHGDAVPLYCTDFERNPLTEGWRVGGTDASAWQWGIPGGSHDAGDPGRAYSGTRIFGTGLAFADGSYPADATMWAETPRIDVGTYSDVRLQFRRWLQVEDGFYDQATIEVNGEQAWANLSSQGDTSHTTHHQDRAWVFQDLPLSSRIFDGSVVVRWLLNTDGGLQLGGWQLDDVCVVANPASVCGDGVKSPFEQCDRGAANGTGPDACRPSCRLAQCGDGIVDSLEECDDGNEDDSDSCSSVCTVIDLPPPVDDGTCAAGGGGGPGAAAGLGLGLALVVARRRRRR